MDHREKLLAQIVEAKGDANVGFEDLLHLLVRLGFEYRVRGSHHVFRKTGIPEKINLQRDGNKAKPYQVRQVRTLIRRYHLELRK